MDQKNQYPYGPTGSGAAGAVSAAEYPPAYTPYPPQQQTFYSPAAASQYGQGQPSFPSELSKAPLSYPNSAAPPPNLLSQGHSGGVGVPPVGFYIPPAAPHAIHDSDDESKLTPFHGDIDGYSFSEKSIRMAFIRKVFGILSVQLTITSAFIALFVYNDGIKLWARENSWFIYVCLGMYLVTVLCLVCCETIRRKAPQNYIFLSIFTLATSVLVGVVCSTYDEKSVLLAFGVTVVVCASLTVFAFQTKIDFTVMGGVLFVLLIILILFGFMTIFLRGTFPMSRMIYNALGALLFSFFLIYDVQMLIGGNHKYSVSPEEYVFAALTIYLDVINIFLYLLKLFGQKN